MTTQTITIELPPRFYDSHVEWGLTAGTELHRTQKFVRVEVDRATFDSLLTDARNRAESDDVGTKTSGTAALKRLEAVEWPEPAEQVDETTTRLLAAQAAVEAARVALVDALEARRQLMRDVRDGGTSVYAIAKLLGMTYSAAKSTIDRETVSEVNS